jgi:hypothetical protein
MSSWYACKFEALFDSILKPSSACRPECSGHHIEPDPGDEYSDGETRDQEREVEDAIELSARGAITKQ